MNIKYSGSLLDPSGYGQANRMDVIALYLSQINLTTEIVHMTTEQADYGWTGSLVQTLRDRVIDYKIKILHLTPDCYPKYMEPGKYHIGRLFFETNKLPKEWVAPCNQIQEIWTASKEQAEMIKASGVSTPIKWFPQPINVDYPEIPFPSWKIPNFGGFVFYSVFQWIERKNPKALLQTYWKTFTGKTDVVLVLKTYRNNYSEKEFEVIKNEVKKWKTELNLQHYPRVLLVGHPNRRLFNSQEMFRLHKSGDCFISTSSGEGYGIPMIEASLMGKPVIAINKTGFAEIFPKSIFYPVECAEVSATQVHWIPWYTADMNWWKIDESDLAQKMLEAYHNPEEVKERGLNAQDFVKTNLNFWAIGDQMKERLQEIERFL